MLSIVSPILLGVAIIYFLLKRQYHRFACSIAIIAPTYIHYRIFDEKTDWPYYGSAMVASMIAISLLQVFKPNKKPSQLVVHLQLVSLALMCANLLGYVMWYFHFHPFWYDTIIFALALMEVLRLFLHTDGDKKDGANGVYYPWINRHSGGQLGSGE